VRCGEPFDLLRLDERDVAVDAIVAGPLARTQAYRSPSRPTFAIARTRSSEIIGAPANGAM
jgi:hypothetical protein